MTSSPAFDDRSDTPINPTETASEAARETARQAPLPRGALAKRERWIIPLLLITIVFLAFGQSISFEFTSDDWIVVVTNPHINPPSWHSIGYYWTHIAWNLYMPVNCMVWAALAWLAQLREPDAAGNTLNPYVFHLFSVLLHALVVLAVYRLIRRLIDRPWPAAAGAALFAIHPIQAEAVCGIGVVNNALFTLFSILAITDYLDAVRSTDDGASQRRRRIMLHTRALFLLALGLLSKPTAVVAPLIAMTLDWAIYRRPLKAMIRSILPWFLLVVPCALITKLAQPAAEMSVMVPTAFRPMVAGYAIAFYAYKIFVPVNFPIDYGHNPAWLYAHPAATLIGLATIAMLVIAWTARRRQPLLAAGIIVFIAALLPNCALVASDIQRWATVADRYAYIAVLGPAILVAWALSRPIIRQRFALPAIALTALTLAALTTKAAAQASYWHDDRKLFGHTVALNPDSWIGHDHVSFGLLRIDPAAAVKHAKIALRLRQDAPEPHLTLATALYAAGDRAGAIFELRAMIAMRDDAAYPHLFLGHLLSDAGDHAGAIEQYQRYLALDPANAQVESDLAAELAEAGRLDEAILWYTSALQHAPKLDAARRGLALAQAARDRSPRTTTQP